jgi:transcriptional regulatory protein RtcR
MATLAEAGRITAGIVEEEVERLRTSWNVSSEGETGNLLGRLLDSEQLEKLDLFDRLQLEAVVKVCAESRSISDAGRKLFSASRGKKTTTNDADRLRKYLSRFELEWLKVSGKSEG